MSLVPTYVKATDGKFYKNPVLEGKDWFICFDDDEEPELVLSESSVLTPKQVFDMVGIKYADLEKGDNSDYSSERMFYEEFKPATNYFFTLKSNLDPKYITSHDGATKDIVGECVFIDPENPAYA